MHNILVISKIYNVTFALILVYKCFYLPFD